MHITCENALRGSRRRQQQLRGRATLITAHYFVSPPSSSSEPPCVLPSLPPHIRTRTRAHTNPPPFSCSALLLLPSRLNYSHERACFFPFLLQRQARGGEAGRPLVVVVAPRVCFCCFCFCFFPLYLSQQQQHLLAAAAPPRSLSGVLCARAPSRVSLPSPTTTTSPPTKKGQQQQQQQYTCTRRLAAGAGAAACTQRANART